MRPVQSKHGGANVRVPPPLVFLGLIGVGLFLGWRVHALPLPVPLIARLVSGGICVVGGLALIFWAGGLFRRSGQDPAPWKPSPSLVLQGPYRFTRNPMYVGMTAIQIGVGACAGNLWILLLAPVALLVVHVIAVVPEEAYLVERFGADYERYKRGVRRYL
jgi:protein-S-isoprenylcysteine O-methyltransferase Ste14